VTQDLDTTEVSTPAASRRLAAPCRRPSGWLDLAEIIPEEPSCKIYIAVTWDYTKK
jgi:hypothetical protein